MPVHSENSTYWKGTLIVGPRRCIRRMPRSMKGLKNRTPSRPASARAPDDLFPLKIDGIKVVHGRRKVCAHRVVYNSPKQVVIPNVGGGQLFEPNGAACYEYGRPKCPHSSLYCLITRNIIPWGGDSASAAAESRCLFPNAKCSCLHANNNHPK